MGSIGETRRRFDAWLLAIVVTAVSTLLLVAGFVGSALLPMALWESPHSEYVAATVRLYLPGLIGLSVGIWLIAHAAKHRDWLSMLAVVVTVLAFVALGSGALLSLTILAMPPANQTLLDFVQVAAYAMLPGLVAVLFAQWLINVARRRRNRPDNVSQHA